MIRVAYLIIFSEIEQATLAGKAGILTNMGALHEKVRVAGAKFINFSRSNT